MSIFDRVKLNAQAMANAALTSASASLGSVVNDLAHKASEGVEKLKTTEAFRTVQEGSARLNDKIDTLTQTETFQNLKTGASNMSAQVGTKVGEKFNELHAKVSPDLIDMHKKLAPVIANMKDKALAAKDGLVQTGKDIDVGINAYVDEKTYRNYDLDGLQALSKYNDAKLGIQLDTLALEGGFSLYKKVKEDGSISILSKKEIRSTYNVSPDEKFVLMKEDSLVYPFKVRNLIIDTIQLMEEQNKINVLVNNITKPVVDAPKAEDGLGM